LIFLLHGFGQPFQIAAGLQRFGRSRLWFAAGAPEIGLSLESDGEQDEENRFVSNGASNGIGIGSGR
jgi:hypothetical protein